MRCCYSWSTIQICLYCPYQFYWIHFVRISDVWMYNCMMLVWFVSVRCRWSSSLMKDNKLMPLRRLSSCLSSSVSAAFLARVQMHYVLQPWVFRSECTLQLVESNLLDAPWRHIRMKSQGPCYQVFSMSCWSLCGYPAWNNKRKKASLLAIVYWSIQEVKCSVWRV